MTDLMLNMPEGTEPFIQNIVGDLKNAIEKHYGQSATPELLERFKRELKAGEVTLDDIGKHANNIHAIRELAELEKITEERGNYQEQIKSLKLANIKPSEELIERYRELSFKEMSLKTVSFNIKNTEGVEGLTQFKFVFRNDKGELGTVYLRAKSDSQAMVEFAHNLLKVGMEDIVKNSAKNNADLKILLDDFVSDKTKMQITNLTQNNTAEFSELNREFAKLGALVSLQNDTNDEIVKKDLELYIRGRQEALKEVYREYKGGNGETLTNEEIDKLIDNITLNDLKTKNPYQFASEMIEKRKSVENTSIAVEPKPTANKNEQQDFNLEMLLQKLKEKEPLEKEEKQFVIEQLSLKGKTLGQIKEEYPVLDNLANKGFSVEKDIAERRVETPEQELNNAFNQENVVSIV